MIYMLEDVTAVSLI